MKTAIALLLASCVALTAQTNSITDAHGYVTNVAFLTPFTFTNSVGVKITNAVLLKLFPNKFSYESSGGYAGQLPITFLPTNMLQKIGYDPVKAAQAETQDSAKKAQQDEIWQQQKELAAQQTRWDAALKVAMENRRFLYGRVIQKLADGLLVSEGGTEDLDRQTILIKDYPGYSAVAADDWVNFGMAFSIGQFSYTTVNNSENTIHAFTCSTNTAVEYYLTY